VPRGAVLGSVARRVSEACILTLKNKSHSVTAELTVPEGGAKGVIVTQGGSVGGSTLVPFRLRSWSN
jgi:hypothetical protein